MTAERCGRKEEGFEASEGLHPVAEGCLMEKLEKRMQAAFRWRPKLG